MTYSCHVLSDILVLGTVPYQKRNEVSAMNYEIVCLEEKNVVGYLDRTNNSSPEMGTVIGGLWQKLYAPENCSRIKNRVNEKALGIYTDYASGECGDYTVMAAFEVKSNEEQTGFALRKIPAGKYAKFVVKGNMLTAVQEFWQKLWDMELERSYLCDFEEYQNADPEHAEIHIYIGLK